MRGDEVGGAQPSGVGEGPDDGGDDGLAHGEKHVLAGGLHRPGVFLGQRHSVAGDEPCVGVGVGEDVADGGPGLVGGGPLLAVNGQGPKIVVFGDVFPYGTDATRDAASREDLLHPGECEGEELGPLPGVEVDALEHRFGRVDDGVFACRGQLADVRQGDVQRRGVCVVLSELCGCGVRGYRGLLGVHIR